MDGGICTKLFECLRLRWSLSLDQVLTAQAFKVSLQLRRTAMGESQEPRFTPNAKLADDEVLSRLAQNFVLLDEGGRTVLRMQLPPLR